MHFKSSGLAIVFCLILTLARASPISHQQGKVSLEKRADIADSPAPIDSSTVGATNAEQQASADGTPVYYDQGEPMTLPPSLVPPMDGELGTLDPNDQGPLPESVPPLAPPPASEGAPPADVYPPESDAAAAAAAPPP